MVSILGGYQEGEEVGLLTGLHLRLHHRILGDVVKPTFGGVRTSPKDDCGMPWADYTGVFKDVVKPSNVKHQPGLINRGKNAPALRMTVRITRTMRGQRNRDARTAKIRQEPPRYAEPDTPRYAEPAARVRYKYETCFGNNGRAGMIQYSIWIYLFPTLCCVLLLLVTYLPGPVPVSFVCSPI